ncbi:E3 ubiquitin-protein ligase RNF213-like [Mercenaria mercenaria]|uniref:E3 ubiquitin-protein ligase RNF213-like n=1 Tax=Mercenaria mercenaria TaxID=6596 RepID=UPI00234F7E17|nr:E3 ubiquitin-protein ligase RNF213-like [Mercenaria mercenaria]
MRCSSTSCGKEGDGEFCEECGAKMSDEKDTVVNCSGKRKDGALCGSELVPGQRFCKKCGTKVDQSLFTSVSVVCPQCNAVLESDSSFCMECGHSLIQSVTDNRTSAIKTETDTADNKQDKEKEVEVSGAMDQKKNDDSDNSVKTETDLAVDDDNRTQESKGLETPARNLNGSQHSAGGNNLPKTEKQSFGNNETSGMTGVSSVNGNQIPDRSNSGVKEECAQDMNTEGRNRMDHSGDQNGNVPMEETGKSENKLITSEVFQPSKDNDNERENTANSDNSLSDVEPVDGSGTEDENNESRKVKKENSNLPMSSTNTELSEQLKEVVLGNVSQGNVPTNEETKLDPESSDSESDSECSDSDQSGLTVGSGEGTAEKSKPVSKQTSHRKRNRKQKKNKKRMRKERAAKLKHQEVNPSYPVVENNKSLKEDKTSEKRGKVTLTGKPLTEETKEKTGEPGTNLTKSANNEPVFGEAKSWGMKDFDNSCQIKAPGGSAGLFSFSKDSGTDSSQGTKNTDLTTKDKNKDFDNNVDDDTGTNVDEPMITRSKQKKIDDEKTAKERKENENKLKTQKAESSKTGTQKPAERMVHVHFHVFVSEEFKFDPAKHKLILRLGKDELGGWDDLSRVFITKRMVSDKVYEMYYNMKVPARLVVFGAAIPYKYCIWKPEKSEKDEPYRWEHYLKNNQAGQDANRVLILRLKHNTMDEWHQYDGFVEKVPTSYREKFFDFLYWRKELMKHAKKSVQLFTASLLRTDSHSAFTLAEVLEQLEFLMVCLKKIYYHDSKCWDKEETFMSDAGTWFLDVMLENIVCPKKDAVETREEKERRVTIATATVYAANSKDIAITDVKKLSNVCKALLMGPPKNKDTCEELKIVEIYFKGKRKQMKEAFVAVARKLAFNSKDPSWLYLMPWIHFLSEACTPFEKPPFDVNHDRKEPVWWGISHLGEDALKYFKGKTESWTIPINSVLQVVEPLFEMDYLLPRTFMTAVELKDLDAVIKSQKIPLEVCLANLTYFLRTTKPRPYFDWQNKKYFGFITTDEKKVEDSIVLLSEKLVAAVYEGEQSHDEWKMRYLLAASLFNESASKPRENTLAACTQILINLVSVYDNLFIKEATGKFEEKEHLTELKKVQMTAVQWMDDWQWKWDIYMSDILQNWNKLVAVEALRSEKVRDFWNEEILRALLYTLEHKVCTTTSMMANFVTIFCQMLDKYKPCMQESLGKAAFKVSES